MKIHKTDAKLSKIVTIGEKLNDLSKTSGKEYLRLNRGINSVCNINLDKVVSEIDFNSNAIQVYPATRGRLDLREAINNEFFCAKSNPDNILIVSGGMSGLDVAVQILDVDEFLLPQFHWGPYRQILKVRKKKYGFYKSLDDFDDKNNFDDKAIIICDPNNPVGDKFDDEKLIALVEQLTKRGAIVIFDSPYRRVFADDSDTFYSRLLNFENVIINESFSKSLGISGQRIGFLHSQNTAFNHEGAVRVLYQYNGVNAFAQILVRDLLTTANGKKAVSEFKDTTCRDIEKNIAYLRKRKLLAEEFYKNTIPKGIFVIVNKSEEELLEHRIGSVSLTFFRDNATDVSGFSRICVSIPSEKFKLYFDNI